MEEIRVERVLLARLLACGLKREDVALLVRASRRGSTTARRVLEGVAGASITTTVLSPIDPLGRIDREWDGAPVEIATVPLGGSLAWRGGELMDPRGVIPRTLASAAVGHPIGRLLEHPAIDPQAIAGPADSENGAVAIRCEVETLEVPRWPARRLRHWHMIRNRRTVEKAPELRHTLLFAVAFAIIAATLAARLSHLSLHAASVPSERWIEIAGTLMMTAGATAVGLILLDALSGRWLTERLYGKPTSYEEMARANHQHTLRKAAQARGFDDEGRRLDA